MTKHNDEIQCLVDELTMGENSGKVQNILYEITLTYRAKVKFEISEFNDKELIRLAFANQATWSGGYSVHNMCEMIKREEAISLLEKRSFTWHSTAE